MGYRLNRLRWHLAMLISRLGWWVTPEPQRSMMRRDFDEALQKIKRRAALDDMAAEARRLNLQ